MQNLFAKHKFTKTYYQSLELYIALLFGENIFNSLLFKIDIFYILFFEASKYWLFNMVVSSIVLNHFHISIILILLCVLQNISQVQFILNFQPFFPLLIYHLHVLFIFISSIFFIVFPLHSMRYHNYCN